MNLIYRFGSYIIRKIWKSKKPDLVEPTKKSIGKTKRKQTIPKTIRNQVWRKYNGNLLDGKCFCCCEKLQYECWEAGHVIAEACGGQTCVDNLRPVCLSCNRSMGIMNMIDFMKQYQMKGLKNL
jgi:hypothetical protein